MSFSENLSKVVTDQLTRFVTLNRHQLAGHMANLEFWLDQVRHVLAVIDGYQERFRALKAGQTEYVLQHQTTNFLPDDPDIQWTPALPQRVSDQSLREARRNVVDSTYQFLMRLYHDGFIHEARLRSLCRNLNIGIDPLELKHKHNP